MKIITGSTGTTHVTSNNDGEFNQGIFGKDLIVLDNGSHLSASIIDNNTIRVSDGDLIFQGRHALIEPNTTEDITIETGAVGKNRNDLIVARYTLDSATGYENITLEVVKGVETNGAASDPTIETGDIRTGALLAEVALFRVKIENVAITGLDQLYKVTKDIMGLIADLQAENRDLNTNINTKQNANTAITTSNIANQSVKYATSAGSATTANSVAWGNVSGKPSTYAPSSHTHSYLPLSGNSTVNGSVDFSGSVQAQYFYGLDNADARVTAGSSKNNIALLGAGVGCYNTGMTANIPIYASAFTVSSSKHVKENVFDMTEEEANKILDVNIISFDYKENFGGQKNNYGVIAEDVMNIIPYAVTIPDNYKEDSFDESKGINQPIVSVDYSKFVPYLIKMIQIQQSKINELEERLSKLENN